MMNSFIIISNNILWACELKDLDAFAFFVFQIGVELCSLDSKNLGSSFIWFGFHAIAHSHRSRIPFYYVQSFKMYLCSTTWFTWDWFSILLNF